MKKVPRESSFRLGVPASAGKNSVKWTDEEFTLTLIGQAQASGGQLCNRNKSGCSRCGDLAISMYVYTIIYHQYYTKLPTG